MPSDDESPFEGESGDTPVGPRHIGYLMMVAGLSAPLELDGRWVAWLSLVLPVLGVGLIFLDEGRPRTTFGALAFVCAWAAGHAFWRGVHPAAWVACVGAAAGLAGWLLLRPLVD